MNNIDKVFLEIYNGFNIMYKLHSCGFILELHQ